MDSVKQKRCGSKVFGVGDTERRRGLLRIEEKEYARGGVIRGKRPMGDGKKVGIWEHSWSSWMLGAQLLTITYVGL